MTRPRRQTESRSLTTQNTRDCTMTDNTPYTASNSDVCRRYSMREIMTRAWQAFRIQGVAFIPEFESFGEALKWAWAEFRDILTKRVASNQKLAEWKVKRFLADMNKPAMPARKGHRSPLNPHNPSRFPEWGVRGNREYAVSVASR